MTNVEERVFAKCDEILDEKLSSIETGIRTLHTELMNVKQAHQLGQLRELTESVDSCTSEISCRPHACKPDICKHTNDKSKNPGEKDSSAEEIPAEIEEQIAARGNDSKSLGKKLLCKTTRERKLEQLRELIASVDLACADQQLHDLREQYARLQEDYDSKLCKISALHTDVDCLMREIQEAKKERLACADQQLHDLREQYARLQEDYDSKLSEISALRTDVDCLKREIQEAKKERLACADQQLHDLREQYARLQEDYDSKLSEISALRTDVDCLKREIREAKEEREYMEGKLIENQRLTEDRIIPGFIKDPIYKQSSPTYSYVTDEW